MSDNTKPKGKNTRANLGYVHNHHNMNTKMQGIFICLLLLAMQKSKRNYEVSVQGLDLSQGTSTACTRNRVKTSNHRKHTCTANLEQTKSLITRFDNDTNRFQYLVFQCLPFANFYRKGINSGCVARKKYSFNKRLEVMNLLLCCVQSVKIYTLYTKCDSCVNQNGFCKFQIQVSSL